jgi:hypothetical protein
VKFDVRGDTSEIVSHLNWLSRQQVPYALARSLTKTAQFVAIKEEQQMARDFDRPTPYTLNSLYVKPATKQRLSAEVKIKDEAFKGNPAIRFLAAEIYGGLRRRKGFENLLQKSGVLPAGWYAIPASGAPKDAYGNVSGGFINRILSQLQSARDALTNETAKLKRSRNRRRVYGRYFVAFPGRAKTKHLAFGIWERIGSFGGSTVRPVFIFTPRPPHYRQRFKFFDIADQTARMRWPIEFALAMREAIATARP